MHQTLFQMLYMQAYLSSQQYKVVYIAIPTFFP